MRIFKDQIWHISILIIMLFGMYYFVINDSTTLKGEFLNISTKHWLIISILSPIIHQFFVVICWRIELYQKGLSKRVGSKEYAFKLYKIGFAILILSRLVTIIFLAVSNKNTLEINSNIILAITLLISIPTIYTLYSVHKYFQIDRAFGLDHFNPEAVKNIPFVKKGIFKYTSNGMYIYGFLILWIPGLILMSKAALLVALFNHLYIWVHYFFTELPDIKMIYKK